MTFKIDATTANAMLDAFETSVGTSPTLEIRTGSPPTACADADTGTLLANIACPSDFMAPASGGTKTKSGTWSDASADNTGTAGYWRLKDSGTTVRAQGTVTATGGGGDMTVDSTSFTAGQTFTVNTFTLSLASMI